MDGKKNKKSAAGLKLVKNNRRRKRRILVFLAGIAVVFSLGIYCIVTQFSIREIEIEGNNTYRDAEILEAMKDDGYVSNTLIMIAENQIFGQTYLPFVESISMSYEDSHVLKVKVKEKLRAGVFEYMDKYVYFNEEGIALESRNTLFEGVPVITGVTFSEMKLEEKIPVEGDYFDTIVAITKKIITYKLTISKIHFEGENDITLVSSEYKIYLGSSSYLDGKMSRISSILEEISQKYEKGTIDMHLYTDEKAIVTFCEE